MTRMRLMNVYWAACVLLMAFCGSWFVLNRMRVSYYNDAVEGSRHASPYWQIVRAQSVLEWPIMALFVLLFVVAIYQVGRWLAARLRS